MSLKKGDFVEVEYTGYVNGEVFDTTDEKVAKENGLEREGMKFQAVIAVVGERQLLKGVDDALEGKETGKEYKVKISPEDGFGRKETKLLQLISAGKFTQHEIRPFPGLQVNIDGLIGIVRTVSGGRVIVDFNHPLAGKELEYKFKIIRIVEDDNEKLKALARMQFGSEEASISEGKATVTITAELPKEIQEKAAGELKQFIPSIKEVAFTVKKEENSKKKE